MNNRINSNINFGATPICPVKISKHKCNKYIEADTHFILIDLNNQEDIQAIKKLASKWKQSLFGNSIIKDFLDYSQSHSKSAKFYALTTQDKNFHTIEPHKILGLTEVHKRFLQPQKIDLWFLQVRPDSINVNTNEIPRYKGVGTAILDSLKQIYYSIELSALNNKKIKRFYRQNNFQEIPGSDGDYIWERGIFDIIKTYFIKFFQ